MFVQLLYLGELDNDDSTSKPEEVMDYVKLYVMADKYGGPTITRDTFRLVLPEVIILLKHAISGSEDDRIAEAEASKKWDTYSEVVQFVYSNVPSPIDKLKSAIVQIAASSWRHFPADSPVVKELLRSCPEFAVDVLSKPLDLYTKEERKRKI